MVGGYTGKFLEIDLANNKIEEKKHEESFNHISDGKLRKTLNLEPSTTLLNTEVLDLIILFASQLDPIEISTEEISHIIENNQILTHTKIAFDLLNDRIEEGEITQNELEILLNALKQDLKIR